MNEQLRRLGSNTMRFACLFVVCRYANALGPVRSGLETSIDVRRVPVVVPAAALDGYVSGVTNVTLVDDHGEFWQVDSIDFADVGDEIIVLLLAPLLRTDHLPSIAHSVSQLASDSNRPITVVVLDRQTHYVVADGESDLGQIERDITKALMASDRRFADTRYERLDACAEAQSEERRTNDASEALPDVIRLRGRPFSSSQTREARACAEAIATEVNFVGDVVNQVLVYATTTLTSREGAVLYVADELGFESPEAIFPWTVGRTRGIGGLGAYVDQITRALARAKARVRRVGERTNLLEGIVSRLGGDKAQEEQIATLYSIPPAGYTEGSYKLTLALDGRRVLRSRKVSIISQEHLDDYLQMEVLASPARFATRDMHLGIVPYVDESGHLMAQISVVREIADPDLLQKLTTPGGAKIKAGVVVEPRHRGFENSGLVLQRKVDGTALPRGPEAVRLLFWTEKRPIQPGVPLAISAYSAASGERSTRMGAVANIDIPGPHQGQSKFAAYFELHDGRASITAPLNTVVGRGGPRNDTAWKLTVGVPTAAETAIPPGAELVVHALACALAGGNAPEPRQAEVQYLGGSGAQVQYEPMIAIDPGTPPARFAQDRCRLARYRVLLRDDVSDFERIAVVTSWWDNSANDPRVEISELRVDPGQIRRPPQPVKPPFSVAASRSVADKCSPDAGRTLSPWPSATIAKTFEGDVLCCNTTRPLPGYQPAGDFGLVCGARSS